MAADLWALYPVMLKSRLFEEAVARLWQQGLISGEMHLGTGEEAVIAGVVRQLRDGDAMALDHRGTAALLMRGVDPVPPASRVAGPARMGCAAGWAATCTCSRKEHLAASSGIVGAAGPAAAGFALAANHLRPGSVSVAFFGDGAMNQGMLMESLNLASAWKLPVLFVCKDDGWAITTQAGGDDRRQTWRNERAGWACRPPKWMVWRCWHVWEAAAGAIERARSGDRAVLPPSPLRALRRPLPRVSAYRLAREPLREMPAIAGPLTQSFWHPGGAPLGERLAGLRAVMSTILATCAIRAGTRPTTR